MWKALASNALTLGVVLLIALGGLVGWGQSQFRAEGPLTEAICVQVKRGSNMRTLSEDLETLGAVSNGRIFRIGVDYSDRAQDLKAGSFLVPEKTSMEGILDIVTRGGQSTCGTEVVYRIGVTRLRVQVRELDPVTERFVEIAAFNPVEDDAPEAFTKVRDQADTRYRVALAEGVTSWQIVEGLNSVDVLSGDVAAVPGEGRLAPDSYEIAAGDDRGDLLALMESRQSERLEVAWAARAQGLPYETPDEALIMASIVEKETGGNEERGKVASVFVNRINQGMKLQTDPTVIYGITKGEGVLGRGLRQSELRRETPYNTYVINGLPPTPIANPGLASIEAALNPEDTDFIFFVAKTLNPADGHNFAVTLDEHNRNVAAYRRLEAERDN